MVVVEVVKVEVMKTDRCDGYLEVKETLKVWIVDCLTHHLMTWAEQTCSGRVRDEKVWGTWA